MGGEGKTIDRGLIEGLPLQIYYSRKFFLSSSLSLPKFVSKKTSGCQIQIFSTNIPDTSFFSKNNGQLTCRAEKTKQLPQVSFIQIVKTELASAPCRLPTSATVGYSPYNAVTF